MRTRILAVSIAFCSLLLFSTFGCSGGVADDGPTLHPVSGTLTDGDKPLANVTITFVPTDEGQPSSSATTGDDGSFVLVDSHGDEGAVEGKHKIVLAKSIGDDAYGGGPGGGDPTAQDLPFPDSYLSSDSSPKEVTVKDGDNDITIDVSK